MKSITTIVFGIALITGASIAFGAWPNFATFSVEEYGSRADAEAACWDVCHASGNQTAKCEYDVVYEHYMCMFRRAHRIDGQ